MEMNWVRPEFGDFLCPPRKRQKIDKCSAPKSVDDFKSHIQSEQSDVSDKLRLLGAYCPKRKEELVVNKKKIEELELWLKNLDNESTFLLLTGPPGCGKLRTLTVLCRLLNIDLLEWITPMSHSFDPEQKNTYYQSELSVFDEFIIRASRYSNVLSRCSKRIVAVKDIPSGFVRDKALFHTFLENYNGIDKMYVVFIISESPVSRDLFPENVRVGFGVKNINFNPITQRSVTTALQNLVKKLELLKINPNLTRHVDKISSDCNGDLRNALATLQFFLVKGTFESLKLPSKKNKTKGVKSKSKTSQGHEENEGSSNDNKIDIFHGLGRILYAKRENGKLVHNPQDVADSFTSSPQLFTGMIHENYLSTFSSIHDVSKASINLVVSDLLLQDWNSNSSVLGIGVSVATYGTMVVNTQPIRKFQQFNKPRSKFDTMIGEYKDLLESSNPRWKGTDILMDIAPFVKKIPYFESSHKDIINKLGKYS